MDDPHERSENSDRTNNTDASDSRASSVSSKLSEELSNWRRRRHNGTRQRPADNNGGGTYQSELARTIKVRGHETLVIRKPKSSISRRGNNDLTNS
ncbi:MAG: hypothetical protein IVW54_20110 [Candidatus Binataceae bacterium]|nr:hypothetical protein [Candidatus Binataceae bacterium]